MQLRLGQPAVGRHVQESRHVARHRRRGLGMGAGRGVAAHVVEDAVQPFARDLGADVVQAQARDPVPRRGGQHHADQPPARGAQHRRPRHAQMIQKRQRIPRLVRHGVGHRVIRPVRLAPPPVIGADQAQGGQVRAQVVEIAARAGQAGQAQKGHALALVRVVQGQAVEGGEAGHQISGRSGRGVRSGRTRCGAAQRRSGGAPARFTQTVRNP